MTSQFPNRKSAGYVTLYISPLLLDEVEVKELKQNDNSFIGEDFIRTANALENDGLELSEEDFEKHIFCHLRRFSFEYYLL